MPLWMVQRDTLLQLWLAALKNERYGTYLKYMLFKSRREKKRKQKLMFVKVKLSLGKWPPSNLPSFEFISMTCHRTLLAGCCPLQPCKPCDWQARSTTCALVVPAKFHKAAALLHAPLGWLWATRALEKVVSWVVASSGMCQKKEPRAHILVLFRHHVPLPRNPKSRPNSQLRVLSNKGGDSVTLKERCF